jgi:hypothetical protein
MSEIARHRHLAFDKGVRYAETGLGLLDKKFGDRNDI